MTVCQHLSPQPRKLLKWGSKHFCRLPPRHLDGASRCRGASMPWPGNGALPCKWPHGPHSAGCGDSEARRAGPRKVAHARLMEAPFRARVRGSGARTCCVALRVATRPRPAASRRSRRGRRGGARRHGAAKPRRHRARSRQAPRQASVGAGIGKRRGQGGAVTPHPKQTSRDS